MRTPSRPIIPCKAVVSEPEYVVTIEIKGISNSKAIDLARPTAVPPPYEIRQSARLSDAIERPFSTTSIGTKIFAASQIPTTILPNWSTSLLTAPNRLFVQQKSTRAAFSLWSSSSSELMQPGPCKTRQGIPTWINCRKGTSPVVNKIWFRRLRSRQ